jgi:hypothetical protein
LFHRPGRALFGQLFGDDFLEQLPAFAQFQDQHVVGLVVVDFVQLGDVWVVQGHHDGHLFEQFLVIVFFQLRLLDTFGRPVEASVAGFDFVDAAETAAADFLED